MKIKSKSQHPGNAGERPSQRLSQVHKTAKWHPLIKPSHEETSSDYENHLPNTEGT